jgi:hypothetical protein
MTEQAKDPWENDQFAPLDTRTGPDHLARLIAEDANANPNDFPAPPDPEVPPVPPKVAETPVPAFSPEETVTLEDGSSVTTTNDAEGWHATVNPGNGKTLQVFHARTERELIKALMVAQANATKKINQQEKQIKLIRKLDEPAPTNEPANKVLTADQIFEIKTMQQSDPVAAFNKLCEYTTGVSWAQFVSWVKLGKGAEEKLARNEIANTFFSKCPAYIKTKANEEAMLGHLAKQREPSKKEFTVDNLVAAYDDLSEAGLLPDVATKPNTVTPQPAPAPAVIPAPAPASVATPEVPPANVRIERPAGRENATFGLRAGETTTVRPPTSREVPSVEELENLPDDQIAQLFAGVVRAKAQSARR